MGGPGAGAASWYAVVLCAGLAAWLLTDRDHAARRARLLLADGGAAAHPGPALRDHWTRWTDALRRWWRRRIGDRLGWEALCLPAGAALGVLARSPLPLIGALVALPLVRRWLRGFGRQRERARRAAEVIELCGAVSGELRAGRQPGEALRAAVGDEPGVVGTSALAAARFGGDVPEALRRSAHRPGAEGLVGVAACWQVAAEGGAGLAAGLDRVGGALRAERDQREDLRAQLAGTRATASLLAVLPVFGLVMGGALGAEPLRVLFHTPAGLGCLLLGGLLECAGLLWTARVVRAAAPDDGGGRDR
ncbi:type II secretion system F family protein [Streptomyces sp. URMC 123]|uniref:type II secretion system F family protein n=1 Tax=Streptomyces sp. URMC 123 TaxID=3423403 RepID=UPI003F1C4561